MMPWHIGFLTPEYPTEDAPQGGLGNYIRRIGHLLAQRGHRISVIWLSQRNAAWIEDGVAIYEVQSFGLLPFAKYRGGQIIEKVVRRLVFRSTYAALRQIRAAQRVERAVWRVHRQQPFDLLQTSSTLTPGFTLRKNGRIPLVCRVSSYRPLRRSADGIQRSFSSLLGDWLEIRQVLDADASFAPSRLIAQTYARIEGYSDVAIIRTPFDPADLEVDNSFYEKHLLGKNYLLFFGRLCRLKGVDLLGDALPPVLGRYPDLSFVFVGKDAGISGQNVFDLILAKCAGFEDRLFHFAPLPKEQLFPVIENSLAVVLPSRIDNYPNACLEAQALGKIVIATRESSLDEMVDDGETGFLADNGCADGLRAAIEKVLSLTDLQREQMETNVLAHVAQAKQEDRVGMLEYLYYRVINEHRSQSWRSRAPFLAGSS